MCNSCVNMLCLSGAGGDQEKRGGAGAAFGICADSRSHTCNVKSSMGECHLAVYEREWRDCMFFFSGSICSVI